MLSINFYSMASKVILKRSQALLSGFLVMFLFIFSSCDKLIDLLEGGDDDEDVTIEFPNSQTSWDVSNEGDLIRVEFYASNDWEIIVDESALSWISVSPKEGTAGDYTLEISVAANETGEQRYGFVAIVSGDERVDLSVMQYGLETVIDIPESQTSWDVNCLGKVIEVNFVTNKDWNIEVDDKASSWISASPSKGTAGEYTLEISVSANDTEEERYGFVTIVSGDMRKDINIFQGRQETVLDIPESQTSWDISSAEKVIEVNLVTNKDWSVEVDGSASSWISLSPLQGTAGEYTLKISVSENNTENQRNGILTVVCGDERRDIYINQKEKTFQPEGEGPEDMPIEEWK